jgi:hypothetical protein
MHRFRISLSGPEDVVQPALGALESAGARSVGPHEPRCVVWSSPAGIESLEAISLLHPVAAFGAEGFEDFDNNRRYVMVAGGETTVLHEHPVLPDGWGGGWYDEDGARLEAELVAWAGGLLDSSERVPLESTLSSGTETALAAARRLGDFARAVEKSAADDAPCAVALAGVVSLGQLGVDVSLAGAFRTHAELEYFRALAVTKAALHAGRDELACVPGAADWTDWLGTLLQSASHVVTEACWVDVAPDNAVRPPWPGCPTATERMEHSGHALATTCIQILSLFGEQALRR